MKEIEVIVFISGLGVAPTVAVDFLKRISPSAKILCLSYPEANSVSGGSSQEKLLSIVKMMNKKIPDRALLVGWSLGGLFASKLYMMFPGKFRALITICSTPKFIASAGWEGVSQCQIDLFKNLATKNISGLFDKFVNLILYPDIRKKTLREKLEQHFVEKDFLFYLDLLIKLDVRDEFSRFNKCVLQIYGVRDAIVPVPMFGGNLHILKEAGHIPFCTHQDMVLEIIKENILSFRRRPESRKLKKVLGVGNG